jgi:flagellar hook-associated protein 2
MPTINFGNITNVGGKNVTLGSQSGLNIEALVTGLTTAKRLPAVKYEDKIKANTSKITALTTMKSKLEDLKTKLNALRNPVGLTSANANVFNSRSAFMTMSSGDTASNYLGVVTSNGAPIGNYDIEVSQLARNDKYKTSLTFSSRTDSIVQADGGGVSSMLEAGNLVINGTNISLSQGDSLNDIVSEINSLKDTTGVTASILKIDDSSYQLSLTSSKTGNANAITINDTGVRPGVSSVFSHETTGNLNSIMKFNGETITRSSNTISDLLDNTTFTLYQETGTASISLAVDKNSTTVATGIADFLTAYNAIRQFNAEQTATDDNGKYLDTATLHDNSTMRTILDRLSSYLSGQAAGVVNPFASASTTAPKKLGDLGVTFTDVPATDDGTTKQPEIKSSLDLDVAKLSPAIDSYFDDVRKIFEFKFNSTSGDLNLLERNNSVATSTFKVNFASGAATLTHIDGIELTTPVALTVTGSAGNYLIKGPVGTDLSELSFGYTGTGGTINYSTSEIEKKYSLDLDRNRATGQEAKVTKLFGQTLTTPINFTYSESRVIQGGAWNPTYSRSYAGADTQVFTESMPNTASTYKITLDDTQAVGSQAFISEIDGVALSSPVYLDYDSGTGVISGRTGTALAGLSVTHVGNETFTDTNTDIDKAFTVDYSKTRVGSEAQVTKLFGYTLASPINLTVDTSASKTIKGTGAFSGLDTLYTGDGTDSLGVSFSQGLADKMFNSLDDILNETEGLITAEINGLQDSNKSMQESVDKIDLQIVDYRDKLLEKYSALEAAIASANQVLSLLDAQTNAQNNSN